MDVISTNNLYVVDTNNHIIDIRSNYKIGEINHMYVITDLSEDFTLYYSEGYLYQLWDIIDGDKSKSIFSEAIHSEKILLHNKKIFFLNRNVNIWDVRNNDKKNIEISAVDLDIQDNKLIVTTDDHKWLIYDMDSYNILFSINVSAMSRIILIKEHIMVGDFYSVNKIFDYDNKSYNSIISGVGISMGDKYLTRSIDTFYLYRIINLKPMIITYKYHIGFKGYMKI